MWLAAILLAGAALVSLELAFRSIGHSPSIVDDMALWSLQRNQIYPRRGETPVVLLGSSRMQLGFVPREVEALYPRYRAVQLAVDGRAPVAALQDLADDEDFRGIVICAITAEELRKNAWDDQAPYVAYYHNQFSIDTVLNTRIKCCLQTRFVLLYPKLRPDAVLLHLVNKRTLPPPAYVRTFSDRSRVADYSIVNTAQHRRMRIEDARKAYAKAPPVSPGQWLADALTVEPYVQRIQGRGGKVVFVRFPTTDELWHFDESIYPRGLFWDAFARQTSATAIHFRDFPALACLPCPDMSHLDGQDAVVFTRALLSILEERHILDGAGNRPPGLRSLEVCP
jgi:hypothetical protein